MSYDIPGQAICGECCGYLPWSDPAMVRSVAPCTCEQEAEGEER